MPLEVTLIIVVVGISATVLLVHLMGWSQKRHIAGLKDAQAIWDDFYPEETIRDILESDDETVALLTLESGATGLIWALGDEAVVRLLRDRKPVEETATGLCIRLGEFTATRVDVPLADPAERSHWTAILTGQKEAA